MADLPLLRTILAIRQKSWEPSFWEVMDSLVLVAHASLSASRTLLQQLLGCLNFTLDSKDCTNKKSDFYELWQHHKLLKTMEMSQVWPEFAMRDVYINSILNPSIKVTSWWCLQLVKVTSHGTSLKWSRRPSQSARA